MNNNKRKLPKLFDVPSRELEDIAELIADRFDLTKKYVLSSLSGDFKIAPDGIMYWTYYDHGVQPEETARLLSEIYDISDDEVNRLLDKMYDTTPPYAYDGTYIDDEIGERAPHKYDYYTDWWAV